jgi:hypothetical protein
LLLALARLSAGHIGQMGIAGGGSGTDMTEDGLELAQIHAQLQHMGREQVAQRMDGDTQPDPAVGHGGAHRRLYPTDVHRRGRLTHALRTAARVREKQARVFVGLPPLAQHAQERLGDPNIPILVAFAATDMQAHAPPVDIPDLQPQTLTQAQSGAVEGHEEHPVAQLVDRAEQAMGLLAGEHIGQPLRLRWLDDLDPVPGLVQDMAIEELQTTAVQLDRAPRVGFEQIGEVGAQFLGAQIVRTAVEILGGPSYRAQVGVFCGLGLSLQLQRPLHALVQGVKAGLFCGIHAANLQAVVAKFATLPDIGGLGDYGGATSSAAQRLRPTRH